MAADNFIHCSAKSVAELVKKSSESFLATTPVEGKYPSKMADFFSFNILIKKTPSK